MSKLPTSAKDTDGLSIGFDRQQNRRQQELTKNINQKGKYDIRIYFLKKIGFAEHQKKLHKD